MHTRLFSERTTTNLLAFLILSAFIALLLLVPHEVLRPLSVGVVVFAVLAVFGIRAYLRRLESVVAFLDTKNSAHPAPPLVGLLSEPERTLLGLRAQGTAAEISRILRRRQSVLTTVAMCAAIPGICAALLAVFFFSD